MRVPMRRAQHQIIRDEEVAVHLTPKGLERLKRQLEELKTVDLPQAIEDVSRSVQLGDLSENAEYHEAKHRLARIHGRVFGLNDRIKRAVVIKKNPDASGRVALGSSVRVRVEGKEKTYEIVGPQESNPSRGRISHLSPLGRALLGHAAGESIILATPKGNATYEILNLL